MEDFRWAASMNRDVLGNIETLWIDPVPNVNLIAISIKNVGSNVNIDSNWVKQFLLDEFPVFWPFGVTR